MLILLKHLNYHDITLVYILNIIYILIINIILHNYQFIFDYNCFNFCLNICILFFTTIIGDKTPVVYTVNINLSFFFPILIKFGSFIYSATFLHSSQNIQFYDFATSKELFFSQNTFAGQLL